MSPTQLLTGVVLLVGGGSFLLMLAVEWLLDRRKR